MRAPADAGSVLRRLPRTVLVALVRGWQLVVSPWYPPTCRFYPSCSAYAVQALVRHGATRGTWLAGRRLLRCHPWNPGGVDLVPWSARTSPHGATHDLEHAPEHHAEHTRAAASGARTPD